VRRAGYAVRRALIDTGGHRTRVIYSHVIARQSRLYAAFGRRGGECGLLVSLPAMIWTRNATGSIQRGIIDVEQDEALIVAWLRLHEPGLEYIHLPQSAGESFVDELTAAQVGTTRIKHGVPVKTWEQLRERNESLDCCVLALAALRVVAPTRSSRASGRAARAGPCTGGAPMSTWKDPWTRRTGTSARTARLPAPRASTPPPARDTPHRCDGFSYGCARWAAINTGESGPSC
jgi:phage terminase large subunit GpA-like protein